MSQWHNPGWQPQQHSPTYPSKGALPKDAQYTYNLPPQGSNFPRHTYIPPEFDAWGNKTQFNGRTSPPPPLLNQQPGALDAPRGAPRAPAPGIAPGQRGSTGMMGQALYMQMPVQQHPMPHELNNYSNNFQMHADQWEQLALGVRQKGGKPEATAGQKPAKRESVDESMGSEGSRKENEQPQVRLRRGLSAGQKVTRRLRMGCLTCRHRKKRCCETRPKCTECQRLRLNCVWPKPGTERKNKPKEVKCQENMIDHDIYGKIKVLRGIVEYRSN